MSASAADEAEAAWVAEMFRTRYFDFLIKHFHEQIVGMPMANEKPLRRSYTWTKSVLQLRGLTTKAPRRGVLRRKSEQRPLPGKMLFQDGSAHGWLADFEDLGNILCIHEEWIAGQDNTVRYNGYVLQIPANRDRYHFARATIRVAGIS
ncbi:MAG: hypothetical protein EXR05_06520 [Acetobacteraceae bacterium]|nr:hypothetical protein [Acetobacteraceae bacterium]MSP29797.1 hypothetical protein [Acetobacteraceae bacterium]